MGKILFAALILRLINLNQSLWLDESVSWSAARNFSFSDIVTRFAPGDVHPPLYYLLLKLWTSMFGFSEISMRLPSVIAGVAAVFVVYKISKNKLAAWFLAINPLVIYYSQEARMYSMAMLAVSLAVYALLNKKRRLFFFAFLASLYLDYVPWLMLPVFLPLGIIPLIFTLPLAPVLWQQLQTNMSLAKDVPLWGQVVGGLALKSILLLPVKFIFGRIPAQWWFVLPAIIYAWYMAKAKSIFMWAWLIVPVFLGLVISLKVPIFTYHRFLFVLPAFCVLLAGQKRAAIFVTLVSLLSLVYFNMNPKLQREDWRGVAAYISQEPGEVIMPNITQAAPLEYYGIDLNNKGQTAYLFRYVQEIFDPEDKKRILLEMQGYKNIEQKDFNGVIVWKYAF